MRRAVAGWALFVVWLGFLALVSAGNSYCYDPKTGNRGIDAFGSCASHEPLGLPLTISDNAVLISLLVPLAIAVLWWPYRPWRRA